MSNKVGLIREKIEDTGISIISVSGELLKTAARSAPLITAIIMLSGTVYAGDTPTGATQAINGIVNVLALVTNVLGIIFVVVGIVRLVISMSQDNGPEQQKAGMFIATGVALILLRIVLKTLNPTGWIDTSSVSGSE